MVSQPLCEELNKSTSATAIHSVRAACTRNVHCVHDNTLSELRVNNVYCYKNIVTVPSYQFIIITISLQQMSAYNWAVIESWWSVFVLKVAFLRIRFDLVLNQIPFRITCVKCMLKFSGEWNTPVRHRNVWFLDKGDV